MNCTTYRSELENIVFKSINTHPSSMSRQKKTKDFARRYEETLFYRHSTSCPIDRRPENPPKRSRSIQHASFE